MARSRRIAECVFWWRPFSGWIGLALVSIALTTPSVSFAGPGLGVPGVRGGVVTTTEPNAAKAGAQILRDGGNAIDAAAAVVFALNVVEPQSSGIGGGGFMVVYDARKHETWTVDTRETAPAAATPDMFVPYADPADPFSGFSVASTSGLSVGVPGTLRGIELALQRWGTKSFSDVLQPAISLAADGFRVGPRLEESILSDRLGNEPGTPAYEVARAVFRPNGEPLEAGDLLVQPNLARTFQLLADEGPDAFYTGPLAQAIVATQQATRDGRTKGTGRMTVDDLAGYEAKLRAPVEGDYRGYTIKGMGPPSSGGLTVLMILKQLERFPIGDAEQGFGFGSVRTLNTMVESMRLAFADRAVWMGDEDFVDVPKTGLISDAYIATRSALIDPDARQSVVEADDPRPFDTAYNNKPVKLAALKAERRKGLNTTHFSIIDRWGNIVSYTNTVESAWGTGLMVPGYGFLLNNELTDFNFVPTADSDPNDFNPGANDVAPGKRPRSSISPVIVFHGRRPVAAYGSPGGSTIINTVVNMTMNLIDHGLDVQEAVNAPRISQTSADGSVSREIGFDEAAIDGLTALGHEVNFPSEIGSVQAVVVEPRRHQQYGAADSRRVGAIVTLAREDFPGRFGGRSDHGGGQYRQEFYKR